MPNKHQNFKNDLERRFGVIMEMPIREHEPFFANIHDYVVVVNRALNDLPDLHEYWHGVEEESQKIYHDITPENAKRNKTEKRLLTFNDFCLACIYAQVHRIYTYVEKNNFDRLPWLTGELADDYKNYISRLHLTIIAQIEKGMIEEKQPIEKVGENIGIYYDPVTGIGWVHGKRFKFKDQKINFILFGRLYEQAGSKLSKNEIWGIIGHERNAVAINDIVGELREKTGLTKNELVLNNGNVTLALKKLETPPTTP